MPGRLTPILVLGAGRMGGALIAGWMRAGVFAASEIMVRDPRPGEAATAAGRAGVRLNPPDADLRSARTVVLAVKPQAWREVVKGSRSLVAADAAIISIMAGVEASAISEALDGREVTRVMPTTAAGIGQGAASVFAPNSEARARARALFQPLGTVVDLHSEALLHAATAVSGSAPAYLYAFIEALGAAGVASGLDAETAHGLAKSTITGAAALLAAGNQDPAELRRQVTSPGGTTQAALDVLMGPDGLGDLLRRAVAAAAARSRELGG